MVDSVKSHAIVLYTGKGRSPFPVGDIGAVQAIGAPGVEYLASYVQSVVDEIFGLFPLDWGERNNMEPDQVIRLIEATVAERHPELSAEAGAALAWMWSYSSWK